MFWCQALCVDQCFSVNGGRTISCSFLGIPLLSLYPTILRWLPETFTYANLMDFLALYKTLKTAVSSTKSYGHYKKTGP